AQRRRGHCPHRAGGRHRARGPAGARAARRRTAVARPMLRAQRRERARLMAKHLVIVESPAKARTLTKYLGRDYQVKASVGHIVDLPKSKLGVDIEKDFTPEYQIIHGKRKIITELRQAAKGKENVYLAPDPDREGEAI